MQFGLSFPDLEGGLGPRSNCGLGFRFRLGSCVCVPFAKDETICPGGFWSKAHRASRVISLRYKTPDHRQGGHAFACLTPPRSTLTIGIGWLMPTGGAATISLEETRSDDLRQPGRVTKVQMRWHSGSKPVRDRSGTDRSGDVHQSGRERHHGGCGRIGMVVDQSRLAMIGSGRRSLPGGGGDASHK